MDKLKECALAFERLCTVQYRMIIGRKGKTTELLVEFKPLDFHHLMGLGKLKDLRVSSQPRQKVFTDILTNKLTYNDASRSRYFSNIENRFGPLSKIENFFDSNRLIFRYNQKQNVFSLIEADYLLSTPYEDTDVYIFLSQTPNSDTYYCRSFFPKENKDYTVGQAIYTLLFKEKINLVTGKKEVQYDRFSKSKQSSKCSSRREAEEEKELEP